MIAATLALLLLGAAPQDDPVAAEALKGWKHPWADFGDGAQIVARETIRQPDISAAGKLVYKDVTSEITTTVVAVAGEKTTLRIQGAGQESEFPFYMAPPSWSRGRGERRGTEELDVAGTKRECQVTMISLDAGKDAAQVTVIWKSSEVPYWAVRWRTETLAQGTPNSSEEERVVEVGAKVKVGDREISCVVVQSTVEAAGGVKTVKKEWRSDEVPGRVARRETRQYLNGKEQESGYSQMEVVKVKARR
jgi:hypothetical protein